MDTISLFFARYTPLLGILIHLAGLWVWWVQDSQAQGLNLMLVAWSIGLIHWFFWFRGDYILHTLSSNNARKDELQIQLGRRIYAYTYWSVLPVLGIILGLHFSEFRYGKIALSAEEIYATGQALYLQIAFVSYLLMILPTCILGWILKPLPQQEH